MVTTSSHTPVVDALTPRQEEVMRMIAAGRTNYQIAEALGVSLDGAKYHVREILAKYGVASREEAVAAWQSGARARRWRWISAAGVGFGKLAVIGAVLGVLAAIAVGLLIAIFGEDDEEPPPSATDTPITSPTAAPSASPSASPPPSDETILGIAVRPLELADPAPLPEELALYIESGCWGCDGPAAALERVYRTPGGVVRTEDLFRIPGATVQQPVVDGRYITSMSFDEGAGDILVAECNGPYCGGVGPVADGASVTVHHSLDGGVSWAEGAPVDGGLWLRANMGGSPTGGGLALISRAHRPQPGADFITEFAYYPTLDTQPIELRGQDPVTARIIDSSTGPHFLLGEDGLTLYSLQGAATNLPQYDFSALPPGSRVVDLQYGPGVVLVTWTSTDGATYSGFTGQDSAFSQIFRWPDDVDLFFHRPQGGMASNSVFIVTVPTGRGNVPSIVDFIAGTITPVEELVDRGEAGDRLRVKAIETGTFSRVAGVGDGDCLNIREAPSLSANAFACYPDGVLLPELGQRTDADGHSWVFVDTPARRPGWAAAEFLETSGQSPSLASHPAGTRTGIADVDPVIAALEESSSVSQDLIGWQLVECMAPPIQGLGGPPECPEGVPDGTPVEVISGAGCEGYWRMRPDDASPIELAVGPGDRLYGVARANPSDEWPPGAEYLLVYASPDRPEWGKTVYVAAGKIVGDWSGCATSPVDMLSRGDSIVFAPPAP